MSNFEIGRDQHGEFVVGTDRTIDVSAAIEQFNTFPGGTIFTETFLNFCDPATIQCFKREEFDMGWCDPFRTHDLMLMEGLVQNSAAKISLRMESNARKLTLILPRQAIEVYEFSRGYYYELPAFFDPRFDLSREKDYLTLKILAHFSEKLRSVTEKPSET